MMLALYYKLFKIDFRSKMQYRTSFIILMIANFISSFMQIIGIWVLFDRFKIIQGWTFPELMVVYGIVHVGFSLAEFFGEGFDHFSTLVKSGEFDRLLLRPLGTLFQLASRDIYIARIGQLIQGLIILIWGCNKLGLTLFPINFVVILFSIFGTFCLFYGLLIAHATLIFWTTETLEIVNITTYGSVETGQYPMSIYNKYFRLFFIFIIPLSCVVYYPIAIILRHQNMPIYWGLISPIAGLIFLYLSCQFWKIGVRHYRSTGS